MLVQNPQQVLRASVCSSKQPGELTVLLLEEMHSFFAHLTRALGRLSVLDQPPPRLFINLHLNTRAFNRLGRGVKEIPEQGIWNDRMEKLTYYCGGDSVPRQGRSLLLWHVFASSRFSRRGSLPRLLATEMLSSTTPERHRSANLLPAAPRAGRDLACHTANEPQEKQQLENARD